MRYEGKSVVFVISDHEVTTFYALHCLSIVTHIFFHEHIFDLTLYITHILFLKW